MLTNLCLVNVHEYIIDVLWKNKLYLSFPYYVFRLREKERIGRFFFFSCENACEIV